MNKWLLLLLCVLTGLAFPADRLNVVASIPDVGVMAARIGGDKVKVTTLATGREDLHAVPARPSFLPILNRADMVISLGLEAEHAWLPALAAEARNPDIMEGRRGWIEVFDGIEILEVPEVLDRSEGEQHPDGNPHFNIGPQCGASMATNIEKALAEAMPAQVEYFAGNAATYRAEIDSLIVELKARGAPLSGIAIIEYHADIVYFSNFYNMKTIGSVEPKPGVPPTARHLRKLEQSAKNKNVKMILYNQTQNPKIPRKLAAKLECKAVQIANMVGAQRGIKTWIELHRYNLNQMLKGLGDTER